MPGESVPDVEQVKNSDLLNPKHYCPGDQILANRGFTLVDEFASSCSTELIIPAFTKGKEFFYKGERIFLELMYIKNMQLQAK